MLLDPDDPEAPRRKSVYKSIAIGDGFFQLNLLIERLASAWQLGMRRALRGHAAPGGSWLRSGVIC